MDFAENFCHRTPYLFHKGTRSVQKKIAPVIFLSLLGLLNLAAGAPKRPMTFRDIFKFKRLSSLAWSPDAKQVLFQASVSDWSQNKRVSHIFLATLSGKNFRQLTFSNAGERSPRWSPDGQTIAFLSARNGSSQIFFLPACGGEAVQMTHHNPGLSQYTWSRDGRSLYFLAADSLTSEEKKAQYARGNAYYVDHKRKNVHLWRFDLATRKDSLLINGDFSIRSFAISPNGKQIAFIAAPSALRDEDIHNEIYLFDFTSHSLRQLTHNGAIERSVYWEPEGKNLLFISDSNEKLETYYQESIFRLNLATGKIVDLLPSFPYQVYSLFFGGKKKSTLYFTANTGTNVQLFRLNRRNGRWKQLTHHVGVLSGLRYKASLDRLAFVFTDPQNPPEIYTTSLRKWNPLRVTHVNAIADSLLLPQYTTIHWKSSDGWRAEGILIKPLHYDSTRAYPLITQIHGGPESSVKNTLSFSFGYYPGVWAAHGYLIFQPNYRGSTGYGDSCMRAIIGHYFEKDWDDILSGVNFLVSKGWAHKDSLGIMGWSAGGHETNWTVTHTHLFKAASSGAGGADWLSFYAQTDMHYIREIWFAGSPYDNPFFWLKKSAVLYVKNARTPTLIFCGEKDRRVPFPQSLEMYRGLKRNGCPVEMVAFPGSGHGPHDLRQQLFKMEKEFSWFEKYIRNRHVNIQMLH